MNPLLPAQNIILLLGGLLLAATFLAWKSAGGCRSTVRTAICGARAGAILLLAVPLLNPGRWWTPPRDGDSEFAVLLDTSGSMATADCEGIPRLDAAIRLAREALGHAATRGRRASLYTFHGETLAPVDPDALASLAAGGSTDIPSALHSLLMRYSAGSPSLDGVLLLSDGRQIAPTPAERAIIACRAAQVPVFPVVLGGPVTFPDVALRPGRRQYTHFKDQELTVNAFLTAANVARRSVEIRLTDKDGAALQGRRVLIEGDGETTVAFPLRELATGFHEFWVEADPVEGEKNVANNRQRFGVQVLDETIRVLLVEGNPYWDTKFIAQLLERERSYNFDLVYRLSGDRFFSLTADEDSGSSGLSMAPRTAFPSTAEELARYDLMVFGRSIEAFLTPATTALLVEWVRHGGALVLARGRPVTTEIAALEPLFPLAWDIPWMAEFHWKPTAAGEDAGLFGAELPGQASPLWGRLPPLREAHYSSTLKPFTMVLVEGVSSLGEHASRFPVVVSRRFGEGLVVAVNCDDLWRWDFFPQMSESADIYRNFWLQLLNWTASYSDFLPGQNFALKISHQNVAAGTPLRARVLRRQGTEPGARPFLRVSRDGRTVLETEPTSDDGLPDVWDAVFSLDEPGLHHVSVHIGHEGDDLAAPSASPLVGTVMVAAPPGEEDELSADPDYLRALAGKTRGELLDAGTLANAFAAAGAEPRPSEGAARWHSSWDTWQWLLPMLGLFGVEWFLRRRNGLI